MRSVKNPEVRKKEIMEAAKRLFLCKGYLNVTTQEIVDDLGISRGLLYYHFKSKEDILKHIVELEADTVEKRLELVVKDASILAHDKLQQFFVATMIPQSSYTEEKQALDDAIHLPENSYMLDQIYRNMSNRMSLLFSDILKEGNEQGGWNISYPNETATYLMNAFLFTLNSEGLKSAQVKAAKQYIEAFDDLVFKIIGVKIELSRYING